MTSDGLGEMFEGDSADTCGANFRSSCLGGASGGTSVRRPGSEDPHRRERKFPYLIGFLKLYKLFSRMELHTGTPFMRYLNFCKSLLNSPLDISVYSQTIPSMRKSK